MYAAADLWNGTNDDIIPKLAKLPLEAQPGNLFRYGLQQEVQAQFSGGYPVKGSIRSSNRASSRDWVCQTPGFGVAPKIATAFHRATPWTKTLKAHPRARPVAISSRGRDSRRGEAEIPAVDRWALFNGPGLPAFRTDAGRRWNTRRRKDFGADVGQADDLQPAAGGRTNAFRPAVSPVLAMA